MERYYLAGYYLMKPKLFGFDPNNQEIVYSCSGCINKSVFDYWCLSWTSNELSDSEKTELGITAEKLDKIHRWADDKFSAGIIKWGNALPDLATAAEFKRLFFSEQSDVVIYAVYLSEADAVSLIDYFGNEPYNKGDFGLRFNLMKQLEEGEQPSETFIGFDFIGVEADGSFHSFYCHNMAQELARKFALQLNEFGLFEMVTEPDSIRGYLNDPATAVEPVPWYIVKTKRVNLPADNPPSPKSS